MQIPASDHFTPIALDNLYNIERDALKPALRPPPDMTAAFGDQTYHGIPFRLGHANQPNVLVLDRSPVEIPLPNIRATYLLFLHVAADQPTNYQPEFADFALDGNALGERVADYHLLYDGGETVAQPILRRFAIQQARIGWGASAFAAVPHAENRVFPTTTEEQNLQRVPRQPYGRGETRHTSGRDAVPEKLWLYALPNPHPDRLLTAIRLEPDQESAAIYALSVTQVEVHPLRPGTRRKLYLPLPPGAKLNRLGELEDIDIDLGTVISARAVLNYDPASWRSDRPIVQPAPADDAVIVEYIAHPQAKLYVGTGVDEHTGAVTHTARHEVYDLAQILPPFDASQEAAQSASPAAVAPAQRPVKLRVVDKSSRAPVTVRLHIHGAAGEYLPPRGRHRKVNQYWFEDNYGEFANVHNQYSYIDGECIVDLPLGQVHVEITRGYEVTPLRTTLDIDAETSEITLELDKVLKWREAGWVTADTHVHFLSPQTALLEGKAEDVQVVNLLASQWGEMYSNVSDFDGKTTLGARDLGGDGEFLVRVGTENRMQVLGHISLLGYSGPMIHPLCSGGPSESAIGDPVEVTMAEWAQRCIDQGGLVVLPHAPNPQLERAADIVLGVIHAIEMMTFNPLNPVNGQLNPYGLADWYRYLNLGYHIPVVGGSDKMTAGSLLGGIRTYAHLGEREFTYENWMDAVRAGNTFVTVGPLAELQVNGRPPGQTLQLPAGGGAVDVTWRVESAALPIDQVEIVVGGLVAEQITPQSRLHAAGSTQVRIDQSTWIGLRVRGSYHERADDVAAHTSVVQCLVADSPLFNQADATVVLEQIEGAMAYVDTLAPRPEAQRFKQVRASLEAAHNRLHQRLHQAGIFHQHTPLHNHDAPHEH